jgi:O-methyltransferase
MRVKREIKQLILKKMGLRHLHGSRTSHVIRSILDEIDIQYIRDNKPAGFVAKESSRREEMYRYVHETLIRQGAINYLEFGVFEGESIRYWAEMNQNENSRFCGFDSFGGLPEDWTSTKPKGYFDVRGTIPQVNDERVKFIKGWFKDTIPPFVKDFVPRGRLVLHLDADLYSSTMLALVHLDPFISEGTILIFDEFYDREHEFKAFTDWLRIRGGLDYQIVAQIGDYAKICVEII